MALILITGVAGTGKTLYALQKYVIPELKKGGVVYSNIDGLVLSRVSMLFDIDIMQLERSYLPLVNAGRFWVEMPKNAMCVLDEAQNIFNNRSWQSEDNNLCIKYLMEHRHYGHQLVFCTPHIDALDAGIRRVCEFTYKHKSYSMLGQKKTVKCAIFSQANTSVEPLKLFTWHHDSRIYDCYKSYFEDGTKEVKPKISLFRNFKLWGLFIVVAIMGVLVVRNGPALMSKGRKENTKQIGVLVKSGSNSGLPVLSSDSYIMIGDSCVSGSGSFRRLVK
jgi:zona occludens toxin (predicted ATPase)